MTYDQLLHVAKTKLPSPQPPGSARGFMKTDSGARMGKSVGESLVEISSICKKGRIEKLSRLYETLSLVNRAIAHNVSQKELFSTACQACVKHGGFKLVGIALVEPETGLIRVSEVWGDGADQIAGQTIDSNIINQRAPMAMALRSKRPYLCKNLAKDALIQPWVVQAAHFGLNASISLPISYDEVSVGVLLAYSENASLFNKPNQQLLMEIADALSFGVYRFAKLKTLHEIGAALQLRDQQLLRAEEAAKLGHWEFDLGTRDRMWSAQMYSLFEIDPALGAANVEPLVRHRYTAHSARLTRQGMRQAIRTGQRVNLEQELHFGDNRVAYHTMLIIPVCDGSGRTISLHGTVQDITERKQNEIRQYKLANRLAQVANEYEDLYQNAPCGYHSLDKNGVIQRINDTELNWLGYSRAEVVGKKKFSDLLSPTGFSRFQTDFSHLMETGLSKDYEQQLVRKDGSILPVLIKATVIRDAAGNFQMTRSTTYNISDRKKAENERDDYARRLALLSRRLVKIQEEERKRLSASLHDRTSPNLAAIGINLALINTSVKNIPPKLADRLSDIQALLEDTTQVPFDFEE